MEKIKLLFWPITAPIVFIQNHFKSVLLLVFLAFVLFSTPKPPAQPNLMQIDLSGPILSADRFLEMVDMAKEPHIQGVLLRVDSPGGSVAASMEMMMAIKELSQMKPVVAYASGMMTSGSYYASIGADEILANPGSVIGSIGVIMQGANTEVLLERIGISMNVIKAGEVKEAGTFYREWTEPERAQLEGVVRDMYDRFVDDVAQARGLETNASREYAEGKIFTAAQAQRVGLVDALVSSKVAKERIEQLADVHDPIWYEKDRLERFLERLEQQVQAFALRVATPSLQALAR